MPSLEEIEATIYQHIKSCPKCGGQLDYNAKTYPHEGGIEVEGFDKKQWVYFNCLDCDYDWALWKLLRYVKEK